MHFKHYENPYSGLAQYVNCAAANSGADAGMYDASSEIYKLSTVFFRLLVQSPLLLRIASGTVKSKELRLKHNSQIEKEKTL